MASRSIISRLAAYYLDGVDPPERRGAICGIIGVTLVFAGLASLFLLFVPPLITGDEVLHFQYAWTVYNHHLPVFFQTPHLPITGITIPPVQWTSQHPPLYYAILAPFIGPALAHHHGILSIFTGRLVTACIAFGALLLVPFFINRWGFRDKNSLIISGLLVASTVRFIGVAGAIYNDSLAIVLSVIALGISGLIILNGPRQKYLTSLLIVLPLGMLSRASFALNLGVACSVVFLSFLFDRRSENRQRYLLKAMIWPALLITASLLASGWYYLRNKHLTGTFLGGSPEWATTHLHRTHHSLASIITDERFYQLPVHIFSDSKTNIITVLSFLVLASGVYYSVVRLKRDTRLFLVAMMCMSYILASWAIQAVYASHGGAINSRYLLPALLPLMFFFTLGALQLKKLGVAVAAILSLTGAQSVLSGIAGRYHGHYVILHNGSLELPLPLGAAKTLAGLLMAAIVVGYVLVFSGLLAKPAARSIS